MAIAPEKLKLILTAAKEGQSWAFDELLDEYNARLYGYFLRMTTNADIAADLLGEISLRLVRSMSKYNERGRFESWLFTMAANLVRDRIRRIKSAPKIVSLDAAADDDNESAYPEPQSGDAPPSQAMHLAERANALHEALNELDIETREMIMMRHFGEMSFAEIAEDQNKPLGTVLARIHRGLKKLRIKLEPVLE